MSFEWKDYRQNGETKVMTLSAGEFIRRFLLHVLPDGFQRIRYYGFLGNRYRQEKLDQCRRLLGMQAASEQPVASVPPLLRQSPSNCGPTQTATTGVTCSSQLPALSTGRLDHSLRLSESIQNP